MTNGENTQPLRMTSAKEVTPPRRYTVELPDGRTVSTPSRKVAAMRAAWATPKPHVLPPEPFQLKPLIVKALKSAKDPDPTAVVKKVMKKITFVNQQEALAAALYIAVVAVIEEQAGTPLPGLPEHW